ncbi:uncharacterized protein LOC141614182 [Silene latifolia]|uniref:uncharacterized protein LOC141614182 n=1 Tax=Silene latifolia TaxID=37657 RepID=UPI003D76F906
MVTGKCSKYYPIDFYPNTSVSEDGYPIYRRRKDSRTAEKNNHVIDNRPGMALANQQEVRGNGNENDVNMNDRPVDEIETFLMCRYVSASEACWGMFTFEIQYKQPPIQRLTYHLEEEQQVFFEDSEAADGVLDRVGDARTTLTEWMATNEKHEDACLLTYAEFPTKWVWDNEAKYGQDERRVLKLEGSTLLTLILGAKCFADIRTVNKVVHPTYKSACNALGLLDGDDEWHVALNETATWATAQQLREMFVTLLLFCEVTDPEQLWLAHWKDLSDDILPRQQRRLGYRDLILTNEQIQNYALLELEIILNRSGRSLKQYTDFPTPDRTLLLNSGNRLIIEEQSYDVDKLAAESLKLQNGLNADQRIVYESILKAVHQKTGGLFFVYGSGGTGKTYL